MNLNLSTIPGVDMGRDLVAPRAWAGFLLAASWLSAAAFKDGVSTIVAVMTTAATGYVLVAQKIDANRRARRRADFDEALEERKATEAADRESLSAHLTSLKDDLEKIRATEHEIRGELGVRNLENRELRADFVRVTGLLAEANARLAEAKMGTAPAPAPAPVPTT